MNTAEAARKRAMLANLLLGKHRRHFPTLEKLAYFNYGAQGLIPKAAVTAIDNHFADLMSEAPFTVDSALAANALVTRLRETLARELGTSPARIALTENTSAGCNLVLWGLPWQPGDRLLLSGNEYPGVLASVQHLAHRFDLHLDYVDISGSGAEILDRLAAAIHENTRLLVLSHIPWDTGSVLPLRAMTALCRERAGDRLRVLVDGAQSAGVLPLQLDQLGADFYAFTGHKWWCGPEGVGGLFASEDALEAIHPTQIGWRSLKLEDDRITGSAPGVRRLEGGTAATPLYAGLLAALELHAQFGDAATRFNRIATRAQQLHASLRELDSLELADEPAAGLLYFRLPGRDPLDCVRFLEERGVLVRTIPGTDRLRISIHYLTNDEDTARLLDGLTGYLRG